MTPQLLEERLNDLAFEEGDAIAETLRRMISELSEADIQKMDVEDLELLMLKARALHTSETQFRRSTFRDENLRFNS